MANSLTDVIAKLQSIVDDETLDIGINTFVFDDLSRINENKGKEYPVLLMNPPETSIPNYSQPFENYAMDKYVFDLYHQAEQDEKPLEVKWDELRTKIFAIIKALRDDRQNYVIAPTDSVNLTPGHFQHTELLIGMRVQFTVRVLNCDTQ